jgi:tetratricopeptide (TPR) repeat protein
MTPSQNFPSAVYDYLKKFQEDPKSKVFAPLSDAYRKAGLVEEALKIAEEGLRFNPSYNPGKMAHARALFDLGQYESVLKEMLPIIEEQPDHLGAHKLVAESALMQGERTLALKSYKMLLFLLPHDEHLIQRVKELESMIYENAELPLLIQSQRTMPPRLIQPSPEQKMALLAKRIEFLAKTLKNIQMYRQDYHAAT